MNEEQTDLLRQFEMFADLLNETLTRAENLLRDMGFRCSARVRIDDDHALAFGKSSGRWCLFLLDEDTEQENALLSGSVLQRIRAAQVFPELLGKLGATQRNQLGTLQQTIADLTTFLNDLESAK